MSHTIIVLSDGETWESVEGDLLPEVLEITDEAYSRLEEGEKPRYLEDQDVRRRTMVCPPWLALQ